jgi:hypothetical protein
MTISFQIPPDIEQELSESGADLSGHARRAFLLDLYRQDRISHAQLREALGVSFHEAEGLIKEYRGPDAISPSKSSRSSEPRCGGAATDDRRLRHGAAP